MMSRDDFDMGAGEEIISEMDSVLSKISELSSGQISCKSVSKDSETFFLECPKKQKV